MKQAGDNIDIPLKSYLKTAFESLLAFYVATFCMGVYFSHHGLAWIVPSIGIILLYIFIMVACAKRLLEKLSVAAMMLAIPIIPLMALIIIVSLIPLLEKIQ